LSKNSPKWQVKSAQTFRDDGDVQALEVTETASFFQRFVDYLKGVVVLFELDDRAL